MQMNNPGSTLIDQTTTASRKDSTIMKKISLSLILSVVLLTLSSSLAFAQAHIPLDTNCSSGCTAGDYWQGTTYGGYFQNSGVSNPGLNNSVAIYDKYIQLTQDSRYDYLSIEAGIEKATTPAGFCQSSSGNLRWFVVAFGDTQTHIWKACGNVLAADINQSWAIQINPYVSNGGGMLVQFLSHTYPHGGALAPQYIPYSYGVAHSFKYENFKEVIFDTVKGHEVWGTTWTYTSYVDSGGGFHYQTRPVDGYLGWFTGNMVPPPQWYWQYTPAPGNNGGQRISCVYDSTLNSCTVGG